MTPKTYTVVFLSLLALTAATVLAGFMNAGAWNIVVALAIAFAKASLVAVFFMHLKISGRLTWVFAGAGLYWLVIMLVLTLADTMTRAWLPVAGK
jgi:cytochrome c oxidase subunit IV